MMYNFLNYYIDCPCNIMIKLYFGLLWKMYKKAKCRSSKKSKCYIYRLMKFTSNSNVWEELGYLLPIKWIKREQQILH
jgi:hypothetical protein